MPRARKGSAGRRAKNRVLKAAKGFRGSRSVLYRIAKEVTCRARQFSYRHRRTRKRHFRRMWIARINAACRARGLSYSRFMEGMARESVGLNRSLLAAMAIEDPAAFDRLVAMACPGQSGTTTTEKTVSSS